MKNFILKPNILSLGAISWWLVFVVLSTTEFNYFQLLNIFGFLTLILLPGLLTISLVGVRKIGLWGYIGLAVGFSLLELMVVALLGNLFLPLVGIAHPLSKAILLSEFSVLVFFLLVLLRVYPKKISLPFKSYLLFDNVYDFVISLVPLVFVFLSISGAIFLNNGGSGILTLMMLIGIAVYLCFLVSYGKQAGVNVIPTALFFIALALLLMTSLRGWYISGHDIQNEYHVFELTKNNGIWLISNLRDAYNACLSITILPTILADLLKFSDPYVFKVFFQIIFAIVPSLLYLTVRLYATKEISLLSVVYFMAFPTFFSDMPMLNRQEIAFLFLILMFYILFKDSILLSLRRILFLLMGFGIILSHYTTTYTVIAMILFLLLARPFFQRIGLFFQRKGMLSDSAALAFSPASFRPLKYITFSMVFFLILMSFLWSSVLTDTSSNSLSRVIKETISVIRDNTKNDSRSADVLYSLFSLKKFDPKTELEGYYRNEVLTRHQLDPSGTYYETDMPDNYPIKLSSENTMPLTKAGVFLDARGIDVQAFNYFFRQASAKVLQILILAGFLFVLYRKRFVRKPLDTEFILLAAGSLLLVLSQIVLPVLSVEYGILRAFQQGLFFLGIFVVIGSLLPVSRLSAAKQLFFATFIALLFFLSSTGVFTQILGGYGAQLHLNNSGLYYDLYYLHGSEVASISWLDAAFKSSGGYVFQPYVQSDRYTFSKIESISSLKSLNYIYPGLIRKDSYVFLGYSNVKKQQAAISYNGNNIIYDYSAKFLDSHKNLIYNNGESRIYR